ncbi:hypothetical protein Glove_264g26 [Diversispora epigaea]|uniref:Uncharacterized protein n=1 Tax=Diversispora epigaea TaxID=1348612 RepID=A0A397IC87_9GLOM|nr:hypothetical protein Glove_264g26 [Diversispora epigaea]
MRRKVKSFENYYQVRRDCLEKLNLEFERLREIMRAIIYNIEEYNWLIFGISVWFLNMNGMDFLSLQKTDEIYELLSQEVSRLREYVCAKI